MRESYTGRVFLAAVQRENRVILDSERNCYDTHVYTTCAVRNCAEPGIMRAYGLLDESVMSAAHYDEIIPRDFLCRGLSMFSFVFRSGFILFLDYWFYNSE